MPPPVQQPGPGFEERIGTRWVVWIGGLTLALGGFFMVRYSIDAGLLGPRVRTLLGALFALALLGAGEWTRRKESISGIEALPIANIPGSPPPLAQRWLSRQSMPPTGCTIFSPRQVRSYCSE